MARRIGRGEIWMYEFRAPDKVRPVVVLTREEAINSLHSVLVAPITSTVRNLPSEAPVGVGQGLKNESVVNLDHATSVERTRLRRFIGTLEDQQMKAVCRALSFATGCGPT